MNSYHTALGRVSQDGRRYSKARQAIECHSISLPPRTSLWRNFRDEQKTVLVLVLTHHKLDCDVEETEDEEPEHKIDDLYLISSQYHTQEYGDQGSEEGSDELAGRAKGWYLVPQKC